MGRIEALCISEKRGTQKKSVNEVRLITDHGLEGDAHAGNWHRQVSLLSKEKVDAFKEKGVDVASGDFGENIVASGIDFARLPIGTKLQSGSVVLEITQIGKECHTHCAIYQAAGDCIMPREGVFAQVLVGGTVRPGDPIDIISMPYRAVVITLSDSAAEGAREDESGPLLKRMLEETRQFTVAPIILLPDDRQLFADHLRNAADNGSADLILSTGGTGFSPRDTAPEAAMDVADRVAPGIAEAIRAYSLTITKRAMLSRGVSVIRKKTLIITLPGSPKACQEALGYILDTLPHGLDVLRGGVSNCSR